MKNKLKLKFAIVPLLILGVISIFYIREMEKEKTCITEYLRLYYSQLKISEHEKDDIENSMVAAASNDKESVKYDLSKVIFYNRFIKYLAPEYLQSMLQNGEIPNYSLIEYGLKEHVKSFVIENISYKKNISNINSIKYDVLIKSADNRKKVLSYNQTVSIRKEDGRIIITNITDNFGK